MNYTHTHTHKDIPSTFGLSLLLFTRYAIWVTWFSNLIKDCFHALDAKDRMNLHFDKSK